MLYFWYVFFLLLGTMVGSFLNAWIWRMRHGESIVRGRSMCPDCRHELGVFDLIPVFSFIALKGNCRYCKKKVSWQYPIVEIAAAVAFIFIAWVHRDTAFLMNGEIVRDVFVVSLLMVIFVYDFLYMEIWDRTTTVPAVILFFISVYMGWGTWQSLLIGAAIGAGFFLLQYGISKGKWIGGGDIRLGMFMGVVLGYPRIILALFLSYITGAAFSLILMAMKKKHLASETPFGTYLAISTFIALFWGDRIIEWYIRLIGF